MRKLEFVKDLSENYSGTAHLYRVDPPAEYVDVGDEVKSTPYVVASATAVPLSGPQVFILPADANGELLDWGEIGGRKGTLDIEKVMHEWAGVVEGAETDGGPVQR